MRLPAGSADRILGTFLQGQTCAALGCLSPEERSTALPRMAKPWLKSPFQLLVIKDPDDAFPDYAGDTARRIAANEELLKESGTAYNTRAEQLLAVDDSLRQIVRCYESEPTVMLDITSLPKRFFCFFLKRLMMSEKTRNVVVTYAEAQKYTGDHLSEDPMTCANLPGFQGPTQTTRQLVLSLGFESLSLDSFLELHKQETEEIHFILPFPPDGDFARRTWQTLRQVVRDNDRVVRGNLTVVSAWDAEKVYLTLSDVYTRGRLALAPYGPKPHTLGMTLFAIENDVGIYYSQPRAYNPYYSRGWSDVWAYVVKWGGTPCFERKALSV